jgi:hypothetical protein
MDAVLSILGQMVLVLVVVAAVLALVMLVLYEARQVVRLGAGLLDDTKSTHGQEGDR